MPDAVPCLDDGDAKIGDVFILDHSRSECFSQSYLLRSRRRVITASAPSDVASEMGAAVGSGTGVGEGSSVVTGVGSGVGVATVGAGVSMSVAVGVCVCVGAGVVVVVFESETVSLRGVIVFPTIL